jgi:hypothetical protein
MYSFLKQEYVCRSRGILLCNMETSAISQFSVRFLLVDTCCLISHIFLQRIMESSSLEKLFCH